MELILRLQKKDVLVFFRFIVIALCFCGFFLSGSVVLNAQSNDFSIQSPVEYVYETELKTGNVLIPVQWETGMAVDEATEIRIYQMITNEYQFEVQIPHVVMWWGEGLHVTYAAPLFVTDINELRLQVQFIQNAEIRATSDLMLPIRPGGRSIRVTPQVSTFDITSVQPLSSSRERIGVGINWWVDNAPTNANLAFEQILPDGTIRNIEQQRQELQVLPIGEGFGVAQIPFSPTKVIMLRVRLYDLQTGYVYALDAEATTYSVPSVTSAGTVSEQPTPTPLPNLSPATEQAYEDCFAEPFPPVMNLTIGEDVTYNFPPFETALPIPNHIYRTATGTDRITSLVGIDPVITLLDVTCFRQSSTDLPMRRWLIRNQDEIVGWMDEYFQLANGEYWYLLRDSYSVDVTVNQFSISETVVNQDETVTIEWNVENTDHVSIQMNASMSLTANGDNLPPSGSVEITVPRTSIVVFEMIYPPNLVDPLRLEVNCTYALIDPEQTANTVCPDAPQDITTTVQYFENGYMMQFPSGVIVAGNSSGFFQYRLTGSDATFLHDVPDGLFPPANRFSEFWEDELMQVEIGWATGDEATFTTTTQKYRDLTETYETMLFVTPDGDVEFFGYNIE